MQTCIRLFFVPVRQVLNSENREAVAYIVGTAFQRLGLFLVLPILLRTLTVDEYGTFGLAQSAMTLLPAVLTLNLPITVTRLYFDQSNEPERGGAAARLALLCLGAGLASIGLIAGTAFLFREGLAGTLGVPMTDGLLITGLVLIGALGSALLQMGYGIWRAQHRAVISAGVGVLSSALFLFAAISLAIAHRLNLITAIASYTIATLAVGVLAWSLAPQWKNLTSAPPTKRLLREALHYGLPILPYLLSTWFLAAGGRWIGRATLGLPAVAEFTLASQLALIINLLGRSAYEAWAPRGFALFARGRLADGVEYFRNKARRTLLFAAAVALLIEFAIAVFLPGFAPSYLRVIVLFPILAVGALLDVATLLAHNVLMGVKRTHAIAAYTSVSVLLFAILGTALSGLLGLWGLAVSFVCAYAIQWSLAMRALRTLKGASGAYPATDATVLQTAEALPSQPL